MRWSSKSLVVAGAALFAAACGSIFRDDGAGAELNLAFTLERNLVELKTTTVDGRYGRFVLATASPVVVVDDGFPIGNEARHLLQFSERETLQVAVHRANLQGVADALIGADAWRHYGNVLVIDYFAGLASLHRAPVDRSGMAFFRYVGEPAIGITVDGRDIDAIIDTSNPDTLILPGPRGRGSAAVRIAGVDLGTTDVQYADVHRPRIGNRLLANFLVTIDYRRQLTGLWRDPRIDTVTPLPPAR
jgi:hypothetical protein